MTHRVMMVVDGEPVKLNDFVQKISGGVINGIMMSLRGIESREEEVTLSLRGETDITLEAGGTPVPLNEFVKHLLANVARGIASSLDGVPDQPAELTFTVINEQGAEK